MPEYKLTIKDIIKGLAILIITLFLFWAVVGWLVSGSVNIFGETIRNTHPLAIVAFIVIIIVAVGILAAFGKTFEAGFSPYRFFDRFRNKDNN